MVVVPAEKGEPAQLSVSVDHSRTGQAVVAKARDLRLSGVRQQTSPAN
jgi:hypothetical protein